MSKTWTVTRLGFGLILVGLFGLALSYAVNSGWPRLLALPILFAVLRRMNSVSQVLIAFGVTLNVMEMAVNGWQMPVDPAVVFRLNDGVHVWMTDSTQWPWFADRYPYGLSMGDLAITAGALLFLGNAVRQFNRPVAEFRP